MQGCNHFFFLSHAIECFHRLRSEFRNELDTVVVEIFPGFGQDFHHPELSLSDNEHIRLLFFNNMPDVFHRQFVSRLTPPVFLNAGHTNNQILVVLPAVNNDRAEFIAFNLQTLRNFLTVL